MEDGPYFFMDHPVYYVLSVSVSQFSTQSLSAEHIQPTTAV